MLEPGYRFNFYNLDKIQVYSNPIDLNLELAFANDQTSFIGENNLKYRLNIDILAVKNNEKILSIAGIIINKEFSSLDTTKRLLIEGAIFNSKNIRQMSRILGWRTERSARYEKGLNNTTFLQVFSRLISLLKISNPTLSFQLHTINSQQDIIMKNVLAKYENIIQILRPINLKNKVHRLNPGQISNYFFPLQFDFIFNPRKVNLGS